MQARHRSSFAVMGTTASVHVNDNIMDETFDDVVQEIRTELERLEQMFSVYRTDSEISRINRQELHVLDASREVIDVLDACTWLEQASQGSFTIRPSDRHQRQKRAGRATGWRRRAAEDGAYHSPCWRHGDVAVRHYLGAVPTAGCNRVALT